MEQRAYYDFGDSMTFILTAVPVFLICVLLDVIWTGMAFVAFISRRDYQPAVACLVESTVDVAVTVTVPPDGATEGAV